MIQSWETLVNPCADGSENKNWGQVGISHECPSQKTTPFIHAVDIPRYSHHQIIRQWETGVLSPPAVERHSHIETYKEAIKQKRRLTFDDILHTTRSIGLTKHKRNWDKTDISKLITIKCNPFKYILLVGCQHKPAMKSKSWYHLTLYVKNRIWGWNWLPVKQTEEQINATKHN